jgi:hypothetical protein
MMKNLLPIIMLLNSYAVFSQSNDSLKKTKHHLGVSLSPDYCFRTIKSNASNEWIKNSLDTLEVWKLGYTTGLNYEYNFNKKITLATGLLISNKGEKTKKQYTSQPSIFNYNNQYYYLDVPFVIKYNIINEKIKLFVLAGGSCNFFLVQKTSQITGYKNDDVKVNYYNSTGISPVNLALVVGFGFECAITKKWSFKAEPIYRTSITSISNTPLKKYLYSVGLNVGLITSL